MQQSGGQLAPYMHSITQQKLNQTPISWSTHGTLQRSLTSVGTMALDLGNGNVVMFGVVIGMFTFLWLRYLTFLARKVSEITEAEVSANIHLSVKHLLSRSHVNYWRPQQRKRKQRIGEWAQEWCAILATRAEPGLSCPDKYSHNCGSLLALSSLSKMFKGHWLSSMVVQVYKYLEGRGRRIRSSRPVSTA